MPAPLDSATLQEMAYFGGKSGSGTFQTLINLIPAHQTYVEPFLGGAGIARAKRPASANIGAELDPVQCALLVGQLPAFKVLHQCGLALLEALEGLGELTPSTFVYCDPPYPLESRKSARDRYRFEFSTADHERLLRWARRTSALVLISSYPGQLYERALSGWRCVRFHSMTRRGRAVEWAWMNYDPAAFPLHDSRYVGRNSRERERVARRARNWVNGLGRMKPRERQAVLDAIARRFLDPASRDPAAPPDPKSPAERKRL